MKVEVALEWFLNPDHLPLIVGIREGWFEAEGFDLSLKVPEDHYDGMASVAAGEVAFAVNEPLHMLDAPRPGLRACGCFFETDGGVILHRDAVETLFHGDPIRIASPVAGGKTDDICRLILKRWADKRGYVVEDAQVAIEEAGFQHLENLQKGFDGAWLCFDNFEGVQMRRMGLNAVFVKTEDADMPNFSALELFTSETFLRDNPAAVAAVQSVLTRAVERLQDEPFSYAQEHWYAFSGEPRDALSDAIVVDTVGRFVQPVRADSQRWWPLFLGFNYLGLSAIDQDAYVRLFEPAAAEATA